MQLNRIINPNLIAVLHDTSMAAASFLLALYLRLGKQMFTLHNPANLTLSTLGFAALLMAILLSMRLYRGLWRYASVPDLIALTKAVSIAIVIFYSGLFLLHRLEGIPRSVPVIHWLALLAMLGGPRFLYRVVKDRLLGLPFTLRDDKRILVLLVGANENTEHFLRETQRNPEGMYRVVGILEDDPRLQGRIMHGIRIYGDFDAFPYVVRKLARRGERPQRIVLTDDTIAGTTVRRLLDMADEAGVTLARLPRLTEFKDGVTDKQAVRPIAVEDLLGRAQNALDKNLMRAMVEGRRVLVTGAGGTIGSELVRQLCGFSPQEILLLEQCEFNLYKMDMELSEQFPELPRRAILADVRDKGYIHKIFGELKPEVVFHAAAIKHVPLSEYNPEEAILTNVFGTRNVADACVQHGVSSMVLISTDKAVNPTNVMGATKRLAECYCQSLGSDAKSRGDTRFITVRFGNVLGSTGSVVPLFEKQLQRGGPITITHPDMVRYFMTVREAVELVLQAAAMGSQPDETRHGLIFVVDMGQPVRIEELAIQMIRLAGLRPHKDIEIIHTGLRPGEKLYEELFHYSETSLKTEHDGILLASSRKVELAKLAPRLATLYEACSKRDTAQAYAYLNELVPEFHREGTANDRTKRTA